MINNNHKLEVLIEQLLVEIGEDPTREGLIKTPSRVAKAWKFLANGYDQKPDSIINNAIFNESYDEILFEETIPIGERVRDLIFLESEKKVLMILESIPAIAVLK